MRLSLPAAAPLVFLGGVSVVFAAGWGAWMWLRRLSDPVERERKRRFAVNARGRMGEAVITDIRDGIVYYAYEIRGVAYAASQDLTALRGRLPDDPSVVIGHAALKFNPQNPANSIVLCENWSGLRAAPEALFVKTNKGERPLL
jgi:hypothetical protein